MCMDWRGLFCRPKRRRRTSRSSAASLSPPPTKQEGTTSVPQPISPLPSPSAMINDVPTPNPELVSTPLSTPPVALPPTSQDAPILVPEPVSTPTPPPIKTMRDQEVQVPEPDLVAVPSPPPRPKTTSKSSIAKTVGNGMVVALKLLKEAVTGIGVPGLEATVSGVVAVVDLIKDVRDNADDLDDLAGSISNLATAINMAPNLQEGVEGNGLLQSRIDALLSGLNDTMRLVQAMLGEGVVARTANSQAHKDAIQDIKAGINFLLNQFTVQGTLSLEVNMAGARQEIRMSNQAREAHALARENEDLIMAIPRVGARYNDTSSKPSKPCHPGTRTGLLEIIAKWIDDPRARPYSWLCGEVGVGKTTVTHTVAQEQQALKRLGASFFFSRHDDSRRNPNLLFTSIAYQLARFDHGFYKALAETLKPDPDIVKRTPMEQFRQLVLEPLARSGIDPSRPIVLVIDGLDECSDPTPVLNALTLGIDDVDMHLRVLISSRPYATILSRFKDPRLYHLTSETQFRGIDPETLSSDVAIYLSESLSDLATKWQLPSPWPPKEQLYELIRRTAGLMIVASTYTKYIDDPEAGDPQGQLARIISRRRGMVSSPLAELDALYNQILEDLKSRLVSDSQVADARDILAFVILAPEGINISTLAGLFDVHPSDVRSVLRRLTAVLLLPEDDDGNIAPFHASFGEYMRDLTRCSIKELSIDAKASYGQMAVRCSHAIASVVKDGVIGGEYDSATGSSWTPIHLRHTISYLRVYLSNSPPALIETARRTIFGAGIWPVFRLLSTNRDLTKVVKLIDAAGGFENLPFRIGGSSEDERSTSLGLLMISEHVSDINQMSEKAPTAHEKVEVETSVPIRRQALKFVDLLSISGPVERALEIIRSVRCWMKYSHRNVMSFKNVDLKFDEENVPQEMRVFLASPVSIQRASSLRGHLERNNNLDMISRTRMALSIADGLCYLHGSSPPQPHNGLNPYQIMVSGEGEPILYPSSWDLNHLWKPPPTAKDNIEEIICRWKSDFLPHMWYHWNPTEGNEWQRSLNARLQSDVWDFGSILFQMITSEEPLTTYTRLAQGNGTFNYRPPTFQNPFNDTWPKDPWDIPRYKSAVSLLLNTLEASKDIKKLLRSCWTVRPQDQPPMSEVFERLKAIIEAMEE